MELKITLCPLSKWSTRDGLKISDEGENAGPNTNIIKLFSDRNSQIFAISYTVTGVEHLEGHLLGQALAKVTDTRLERLAKDKCPSLFQKIINYGHKKFLTLGPQSEKRTSIFFVKKSV
jgi:hypothetical protein